MQTAATPGGVSDDPDPAVDPNVGLTDDEAARRAAAGQGNAYRAETSRSAWSIIRANVFTPFNGIVFACFGVLFVIGRWQDALFGFAAVGNALIGSLQEFRAKAALDKLALLNASTARCGGAAPRSRSLRVTSCSATSWCCGRAISSPPTRAWCARAGCRSTSRC